MISVFDEVFSRDSLLDELYSLLVHNGEVHNFGGFLSSTLEVVHHNIRQWKGGHDSPNVPRLDELAQILVNESLRGVASTLLEPYRNLLVGYEYWANYSTPEAGIDYHIDRDENEDWNTCMEQQIFPLLSTVLFIGPKQNLDGGDLLINAEPDGQKHCMHAQRSDMSPDEVISSLSNWIRIPYRYNRMIVFTGKYPHIASPLRSPVKRCAVGIGVWDRQIR